MLLLKIIRNKKNYSIQYIMMELYKSLFGIQFFNYYLLSNNLLIIIKFYYKNK